MTAQASLARPLQEPQKFALAGRAIFTVENTATGNRFTYRVANPRGLKPIWFVSVLTGTNNATSRSYTYFGTISERLRFWPGKLSTIAADAPSVRAFAWLWDRLITGKPLPETLLLAHCGLCCRCGRPLTVPESIESGIGPDCAEIMAAEGGR